MTVTPDRVITRTPRQTLRRGLFWVGAIVLVLLGALVTLGVFGAAGTGDTLSASNAAPTGAKALVEVLRQQGVTVTETDSLVATQDAVSDRSNSTILVYDPEQILDAAHLDRLGGLAAHLVLVAPGFTALRELAPAVAQAGDVSGELEADCAVPAVAAAGRVTGDGVGYRVIAGRADAVGCLGSGDGVFSLVQVRGATSTVTVLGLVSDTDDADAASALDNDHIASVGNAALALTLLGDHPNLVWYLPGAADVTGGVPPTIGELTPEWVAVLVALAVLTTVAAAVWRGRRFGPLVVENLPVTVRASETMEGRARLYSASSARLHALDSLRIGTIDRVARLVGLPRLASVDEVIAVTASVLGTDPLEIRLLLLEANPTNDRELVRLSDGLLLLEQRIAAALGHSSAGTEGPRQERMGE